MNRNIDYLIEENKRKDGFIIQSIIIIKFKIKKNRIIVLEDNICKMKNIFGNIQPIGAIKELLESF